MNLDYKAIGKRVKIARINAGINQENLAELAGITPTHLSNIETGTTRVSLQALVRLANALCVSSDDLLCDNVVKAKIQFERDLSMILDDCDDYEIRIITDVARSLKDTLRRDANLRSDNI